LLTQRRQSYPRGDDRERISRARQAAEALFISKPPASEVPGSQPPPPAEEPTRKPRVLRIILPAAPVAHEAVVPAGRACSAGEARDPADTVRPHPDLDKIRGDGSEVAKIYGAAVGEVERILRHA
jgi:hypothetical protein